MRWTRRCRVRMRSQGEATRERSREARETSGSVADGQSVWSWRPLLVSSFAEAHSAQPGYEMPCNSRGDGGKTNSSPGRARHSLLKPSRGECRMFSGASAVNTRAHTQTTLARTRLRVHWAPGIPRALFSKGDGISGKPWACHAARPRMHVPSLRGALATKQSILFAARWIASLALAMTMSRVSASLFHN
jgi:hypothetical protein